MTTMKICGQEFSVRIISRHRHHERVTSYVGVIEEGQSFSGGYVTWTEIDGVQKGASTGPAAYPDLSRWERDCESQDHAWRTRWLAEHDERKARAEQPGTKEGARVASKQCGDTASFVLGLSVRAGKDAAE